MTTSHEDVLGQARPVVRRLTFWYSLLLAYLWIAVQTGAMIFVVPMFREMFADFEFELPRATQWLLATSEWMGGDRAGQFVPGWIFAVPLAVVVVTGLFALLRRAPLLAMALATMLLASIIAQVLLLLAPLYGMVDAVGQ